MSDKVDPLKILKAKEQSLLRSAKTLWDKYTNTEIDSLKKHATVADGMAKKLREQIDAIEAIPTKLQTVTRQSTSQRGLASFVLVRGRLTAFTIAAPDPHFVSIQNRQVRRRAGARRGR